MNIWFYGKNTWCFKWKFMIRFRGNMFANIFPFDLIIIFYLKHPVYQIFIFRLCWEKTIHHKSTKSCNKAMSIIIIGSSLIRCLSTYIVWTIHSVNTLDRLTVKHPRSNFRFFWHWTSTDIYRLLKKFKKWQ